jgi:hypothetical protein
MVRTPGIYAFNPRPEIVTLWRALYAKTMNEPKETKRRKRRKQKLNRNPKAHHCTVKASKELKPEPT